jgi:AcrR family transcriptional regulator
MARPSRQVDEKLLQAGRELLPVSGIAGLSVRRVATHAGVNLGMFHYHFRNKDAFVRAVLDRVYQDMYAQLPAPAAPGDSALAGLRQALAVLAGFARGNRQLLVRILADAVAGGPVSLEFLRANVPRHLAVLRRLVEQAQRAGEIDPVPLPVALSFLGGAVAAPVLFGGALQQLVPGARGRLAERHLLSARALEWRIDMALRGLGARGAPHGTH